MNSNLIDFTISFVDVYCNYIFFVNQIQVIRLIILYNLLSKKYGEQKVIKKSTFFCKYDFRY